MTVKYEKTVDRQRPRIIQIYWESHLDSIAVTLASLKERIESVYVCIRTKPGPCWWAVH